VNVLVLGGTRFVGKRLVRLLAERGHEVTVATRGRAAVTFPDEVRRITLDRSNADSVRAGLNSSSWDIVYDQICFSADDASMIVETISGKTGRYVLCSSAAVYRHPAQLEIKPLLRISEEAFEPLAYPLRQKYENLTSTYDSYAEGKRMAEAVAFQKASFPVVSVRFPIILGPDDYSKRLRVQVRRISAGEPVNIVNPESEISLISSSDAAEFLAWLATVPHTGPFNACSDGSIALTTIVQFIEKATGRTAVVTHQPDEPFSIFRSEKSFTLSTGKARRFGFTFSPTQDWLRERIREEAEAAA